MCSNTPSRHRDHLCCFLTVGRTQGRRSSRSNKCWTAALLGPPAALVPHLWSWYRRKDGKLRFWVNFWQLNSTTVKDADPLPHNDDLLDALHDACRFSTLDLKSGYWQVPSAKRVNTKRTSNGQLFEFNQVPFSLCNAPVTFSCLMDCVLTGLNWETYLFHLDNIIMFSKLWENHIQMLEGVFQRL